MRILINLILSISILVSLLIITPVLTCYNNDLGFFFQGAYCNTIDKQCCCFNLEEKCLCMQNANDKHFQEKPFKHVYNNKNNHNYFSLLNYNILFFTSHIENVFEYNFRPLLSLEIKKTLPLLN